MVGRLGYENLPTIAMWRADTYLDLTTAQRDVATRRIEGLQSWHRQTQLDDYVDFLKGVQRRVASGPIDESDIRRWRLEAFERLRPLAEQAAPGIAEVAVSLEPRQIARMKDEIERGNRKLRKEWMPPGHDERIEARSKRYIDRAEVFMGGLSSQQKQLARRLAAEAPPTEDVWYAQRVARQQDLLTLMERIRRARPSAAVATAWIREHLLRYAQPAEGPERSGAESSLASSDAMTATMLAQATPKQRDHLQRKLQEWVDLLQSLKPTGTARAMGEVSAALR